MKRDERQLGLDLEVPAASAGKSRRAKSRRAKSDAPNEPGHSGEISMMDEPELSACGFCGRRITIHAQVTICPGCGGIVSRPDEDD
ncbi:MAG: hypothetical protein KBI47_09590 [Armatimonadetes bacterium]|nr:hypothetical protein [Armatimonadota bacterium]MDI9583336.1 hypothetical protein [Acidobacteriota bacterium]